MYQRAVTEIEQCVDSIELKLGMKGGYAWNIKLFFLGGDEERVLARLERIDAALHERFAVLGSAEEDSQFSSL